MEKLKFISFGFLTDLESLPVSEAERIDEAYIFLFENEITDKVLNVDIDFTKN